MAKTTKNLWSRIGYWIVEAAIIFISVYLAFLLNGYRNSEQQEHKKQQIYTALYQKFSTIAKIDKQNSAMDSLYVRPFLKAYRNNKMPRLKKWPFLKLTINDNTWNAMLQAGGISLLDIELIRKVSNFYHHVDMLRQETIRFNKMTDKYLISNINAGISTFYNTETKKLLPRYQWYIHFVEYYEYAIDYLADEAKEILKMLREKMNNQQLQKITNDSTSTEPH